MKKHRIIRVLPGCIGEELEIAPGSLLLEVGGQPVEDIFDYEFLCRDEHVELLVETEGEEILYDIDKEEDEDLGLEFENGLMDDYRSCRNKCIFCFIDQMPKGMRPTLYFKDDDARLSFLQGNYVTLTNLDDHDIERIIRYRLEPINISVHTMDPALRCRMLNNRFAGEALKKLDRLFEAGITMNGQIVLCPGINDREELDRTLEALSRYLPCMESVSVVPVGLTRFREGLEPLRSFTPEEAADTVDRIEAWQRRLYPQHELHFCHASDEFYLLAGRELPEEDRYDGYLQLENGVGMLRLFREEAAEALKALAPQPARERSVTVATGRLATAELEKAARALEERCPGLSVRIRPLTNHFFGESITVAGLITGQDLISQLKEQPLGEAVYIPSAMLRSGEEVFLDDVTLSEVQSILGVPVIPLDGSGAAFIRALSGAEEGEAETERFRPYELTEDKELI